MTKKSILLSNGETYFYIDEGKGKEIILLVHGNMSSSVHYKPLINRLKNKFRVIAPDMRGFGDSSYNMSIKSLEDLSDDLFLLLKELSIDVVNIVGWSTGGAVVLKLAAKHNNLINKIVLIESASYKGYPVFMKDKENQPIIGSFYDNIEDLAKDPVQVLPVLFALESGNIEIIKSIWDFLIYNVNKPSKEEDDLYLSETMKQRNIVDIDWCLTTFNMSDSFNGVSNGDGSIKNVNSPVLSIWSENDLVVPEYMVDETVSALKDAKKVMIPNSGHSPMVDSPDLLWKIVNEFFDFLL